MNNSNKQNLINRIISISAIIISVSSLYFSLSDNTIGAIAGYYRTGFKLFEDQQILLGTSTATQQIGIFNNNGDTGIEFSATGTSKYKYSLGLDYSASAFTISSSSALGTDNRLVIKGNGRVGIGTSTPDTDFNIYSVGTTTLSIETTGANPSCLKMKHTNGLYYYCKVGGTSKPLTLQCATSTPCL